MRCTTRCTEGRSASFAYKCCKTHGGAAGVDDQTFEDIEAYGVERWLDELMQELKSQKPIDLFLCGGCISRSPGGSSVR